MKRNYSLDFYRVLCTAAILLYHGKGFAPGAGPINGYRCVEFFFIMSGFLLYRSFVREQDHSSYRFFVHRLKRLYPEYLIAALCTIFVCGVLRHNIDLSQIIAELSMTTNTGITVGASYNDPAWYVTSMFAASVLLYGMLSLSEKASGRVVLPLIVVCGYSLIWGQSGQLQDWSYVGPFEQSMIRALSAMSIGILLGMLERAGFLRKFSRGLQAVLEIVFLALFAVGLYSDVVIESVGILAAAGLVLITAGGQGIIARLADRKIFGTLGKYTYSVYLINRTAITVMFTIDEKYIAIGPVWLRAVLLLLLAAAYSAVVYQGVTWLQKRRAARAGKISA